MYTCSRWDSLRSILLRFSLPGQPPLLQQTSKQIGIRIIRVEEIEMNQAREHCLEELSPIEDFSKKHKLIKIIHQKADRW